MDDWDLSALAQKWQTVWWGAGIQHAERPPDWGAAGQEDATAPTFFIHFAYPGISGYLHVGHMRGFTYADVLARFKRQTGFNVLYPAGFHASGIPAVAFAKEVERGDKDTYLRDNGYQGDPRALADPRAVVDYFAGVYTNDYWKRFGFLIDERRNCTTVDAGYQRFIQWQFRRLADHGWLVEKPHYAPFCPVAGPVAVDKSETDLQCGGSAEILEFVALKFVLPAGGAFEEEVILPCATLRPETVYGVTNIWLHPDATYHVVRVWEDGAVADGDPHESWLVSEHGVRKLEWQFERAEATGQHVHGSALLGEKAMVPVTGNEVPIVAGTFVDPNIATGVVMSVPAHAPYDYAAYVDAGLLEALGEPPQIIDIKGYDDLPARQGCKQHGVQTQGDKAPLDEATAQVYADEFTRGVLNDRCLGHAGKPVRGVKAEIQEEMLTAGIARILRQFSELVVSRAGEIVDIKRIPDQDFIHYADADWTRLAKEHAASMMVRPQRYGDELSNVLDWFGDRACVRRGAWLGTPFPFKEDWIVEPIADSTFYPWFYIVSPYIRSGRLDPDALDDAFFDFVFNGIGAARDEIWNEVRRDVLYWGPVDINLGGKEHQTVHFPVYIMNMCGLMERHQSLPGGPKVADADGPRSYWPRGLFVNWWVTQKAGTKISKSKGGAEPIPGAAQTYGVDAMRLYYCHVGSAHVDIEWDPEIVGSYKARLLRIGRMVDALPTGGAGPMDGWLLEAVGRALDAGRSAYESMDLRGAATAVAYTIPEAIRWYLRRGGENGILGQEVARAWAAALCPIVPHIAEEIWQRCGGEGLCTVAPYPTLRGDWDAIDREDYIRMVLDDLQTVQRLAGVNAKRALLFATPDWKRKIARRALEMHDGGALPMGPLLAEVMAEPVNRDRGREVQAFCKKIPAWINRLNPAQKRIVQGGADEASMLAEAADFLGAQAGVAVTVYGEDGPEHAKRAVAAPLKPGIGLIE